MQNNAVIQYGVLALVVIVGGSIISVGLWAAVHGGGNETVKTKWLELGGGAGLALVVVGVIVLFGGIGADMKFFTWGVFAQSASSAAQQGHPESTAWTDSGPSTALPPAPASLSTVFLTPSGNIYCATYVSGDHVGCVIKKHTWGKRCHYLYTVGRTGTPTEQACITDAAVKALMYDSPPRAATKMSGQRYGSAIDMGLASCTVEFQYVECHNPEHGFTISRSNTDMS